MKASRIACVIPARLNASRFPRKMVSFLAGKPLLQWVWENSLTVPYFSDRVIAIDSLEIAEVVESFGGRWMMTNEACASGTDRLIELAREKKISADIWVNWQGDEPFISRQEIDTLLQSIHCDQNDIWTLKAVSDSDEEAVSPHIAKVVCDQEGRALFFSRHLIPSFALHKQKGSFFKHIGLYAYTQAALEKLDGSLPCDLEISENLEQLRFLHLGLKIGVHTTNARLLGIDLPEHAALAQARLLETANHRKP